MVRMFFLDHEDHLILTPENLSYLGSGSSHDYNHARIDYTTYTSAKGNHIYK